MCVSLLDCRFDHKDEEVNNVKEIPSEAKMLQDQFHGIVKVQSPKVDYGPATKLLPTLEVETDPDTIIITVDVSNPPESLGSNSCLSHTGVPACLSHGCSVIFCGISTCDLGCSSDLACVRHRSTLHCD